MDLFIIPTFKEEVCVLRQNSKSETICDMDMLVLWESSGSSWSLHFTMLIKGSMGTEVKSSLTSYNAMTSPGSSLTFFMCSTKCWVFLRWCEDWPTKGQMMLAYSLATPYVMDPILENMGLRGIRFMYFG